MSACCDREAVPRRLERVLILPKRPLLFELEELSVIVELVGELGAGRMVETDEEGAESGRPRREPAKCAGTQCVECECAGRRWTRRDASDAIQISAQ